MKFDFTLTGTTSLLMKADDVEFADMLTAWRRDPANRGVTVPGDDRSPAWTWQGCTYANNDSPRCLAMPAENIMACLRKAGTQMILKKQKTFKEATQSGLLLDSEFCKFLVDGKEIRVSDLDNIKEKTFAEQAEAVKKFGFTLFVKRANMNGKSKNVRVRPRFPKGWQVKGTIHVLLPEITKEILQRLFDLAGMAGLGDWRPSAPKSPGSYGMFEAKVY